MNISIQQIGSYPSPFQLRVKYIFSNDEIWHVSTQCLTKDMSGILAFMLTTYM